MSSLKTIKRVVIVVVGGAVLLLGRRIDCAAWPCLRSDTCGTRHSGD